MARHGSRQHSQTVSFCKVSYVGSWLVLAAALSGTLASSTACADNLSLTDASWCATAVAAGASP